MVSIGGLDDGLDGSFGLDDESSHGVHGPIESNRLDSYFSL